MEGRRAEGAVSSAALHPPQSYICKLHPRNWHVVCTQRPRICLFPLLLDQACWLLSEFFICISPWLFLDWVSFRPVRYERGLVGFFFFSPTSFPIQCYWFFYWSLDIISKLWSLSLYNIHPIYLPWKGLLTRSSPKIAKGKLTNWKYSDYSFSWLNVLKCFPYEESTGKPS